MQQKRTVTTTPSSSSLQLVYVPLFITRYVCVACFHRLRWISLRCSLVCKFQLTIENNAVCLSFSVNNSDLIVLVAVALVSHIGYVTSAAFYFVKV